MKLKINGREYEIEKQEGLRVFKAAKNVGVDIPNFTIDENCHFNAAFDEPEDYEYSLKDMSVVEINGKLVRSYEVEAEDGMEIWTDSPKCKARRKEILGKVVSFHPLDCVNCVKLGDCKLQRYCDMYGVKEGTEKVSYIKRPKDMSNRFYFQEFDKCIRCGRCVKVCKDKVGVEALEMVQDGKMRYVVPNLDSKLWKERIGKENPSGKEKVMAIIDGKVSMADSTRCVSCGNCVSVCPVGAIMPKSENDFRAWETKKTITTCTYCGVGCQIEYSVKNGKIVDAKPANGPSNEALLCVKGKFGYDFINHKDRLKHPMIRKNGKLVEATWEEALDLAASKIKEARDTYGPDSVAGFSSARTVNEDNYLFQKMLRAAVGTNNVDHCARL